MSEQDPQVPPTDPQDVEAFAAAHPDVVASNAALAARSRARREARQGQ